MSFVVSLIGFMILLGGLNWGAVEAGVPHLYIGIGSMFVLVVGILSAVSGALSKELS